MKPDSPKDINLLKIAFLTHKDNKHIGSWMGTTFYMRNALGKIFPDIQTIELRRPNHKLLHFINKLTKRLFNRSYNFAHSFFLARKYASELHAYLSEQNYDIIIAPAFSTSISRLKTDIPIIYISDTTFKLLYGYYDWFSNFWGFSIKESHRTEKLALQNSRLSVFASSWAAESAIHDYGIDLNKTSIIPLGANFDVIPDSQKIFNRKKGSHCKLLFIGREWDRKRGNLVLETFYLLCKLGFPCQLTLIGSVPPESINHPMIQVIPFIDKTKQNDQESFLKAMYEHHFLFVPSLAECFGIVFSEASAFGMPSITTDTGGISSAVHHGINGYLHPLSAGPEQYAKTIMDIYQNFNERYLPLSKLSREFFETQLNWDQWAASMKTIIDEATNRP